MDTPVSHTHTQDTRKCLFKSPVDAMQECYLPGYVTPHEASLTIQTFMIEKWDMHTKEKRHTKKYVVWGFYISKNINIIIII